ncbi:16S rRNA (cytosine(1402)-N(4))-methyltransferase RsmH [bacterium SCSIO 12643]|nr:16S rRNA (cytosine(1402)-N(4))-methyltransferase RsmH [bacterium SCSIO 12643]
MYHKPVLLSESIEGLAINPSGDYVDVTFGGGGHSREILNFLGDGRLFGFDQDADAHANALEDERFTLIPQNFRYLSNFLKMHKAAQVDGVLADLGVSSHQFDEVERGFSFRGDADLDMRMNQNADLDAKKVLNTYEESDLIRVFREYGELKNARRLAAEIVGERVVTPINRVSDLLRVADAAKVGKIGKNYMAQVFQALRIEVNDEIGALKEMLKATEKVLKPNGRLSVITYHSLEDRLVKNYMRTGNFEGKQEKDFYGNLVRPFEPVNRKVIVPTEKEIEENQRARSAKLRVAVRV